MASPQYTTVELIENIKRRCAVPTSQLTYTPEDFTLLANDEMQGEVVPLIMSTREEYFVDFVDVIPTGHEIDIPDYCVGEKLRSVCFVVQTSPLILVNLPRIDLDVVAGVGFVNFMTLAGFYIQGNKLILYPSQSVPQNQTIRLYYYRRTLVLAAPSTFGRVVAIDTNSNTIQLSFVPNDWDVDTVVNSVSPTAPFTTTNESMVITAVSSPSIVVDNVDGLSVGDYIAEEGFSAIPQILIEAHPYLAQLTAIKVLEGLGGQGMENAQAKAELLKKNLLILISQRVDGSVKKVMSANGGLRSASGLWRRGFNRY